VDAQDEINDGIALFASLQRGDMPDEVWEAHQKCIAAAQDTGKKSTLNISIEYAIKRNKNGDIVNFQSAVKTKLPEIKAEDEYFLHPKQMLSKTPEGQQRIEFETAGDDRPETVATACEEDNAIRSVK
jgi:hypothetical protein